jgi:hypothetical protein
LATIDIEQAQENCSHYGYNLIQEGERQAEELFANLAKTQNGKICRNAERH